MIRALAQRVGQLTPGLRVLGATLAKEGSLEAALSGVSDPLVYPMFMADGWFVRTAMTKRLSAAGHGNDRILQPFGLDPAVWELCRNTALQASLAAGWGPRETTVLLAAHGSPSCSRPRETAERVALHIGQNRNFRNVIIGYIDEAPHLADVAALESPAVCIPFFAAIGGHVRRDIPDALSSARFTGKLLPPVGCDSAVSGIIARSLRRQQGSMGSELLIAGE